MLKDESISKHDTPPLETHLSPSKKKKKKKKKLT